MMAGRDELRLIHESIDSVPQERAAEEQNLRRQEHPHAELRGDELLLGVVEVVCDRHRGVSGCAHITELCGINCLRLRVTSPILRREPGSLDPPTASPGYRRRMHLLARSVSYRN